MMNSDSVEILTIEEFAERLKIGRTTCFEWKKKGKLKVGVISSKMGESFAFYGVPIPYSEYWRAALHGEIKCYR